MNYPCTRCGLCCLKINRIPALANFHNGDGICVYFRQNIGCTIYDERPLVCRIDEGYQQLFKNQFSLADFYQKNADVCNSMQLEAGFPNHYRIKLK
ncbi:MAG: YkgJ family cysteine cluster protein [Enterovibrio sp.]